MLFPVDPGSLTNCGPPAGAKLQYSQYPGCPWLPGGPRGPRMPCIPGGPLSPDRPSCPTPVGPGGPKFLRKQTLAYVSVYTVH